ncbi:hypothetical protein D3C86_1915790 [compost metagenome]
MIFILFKKKEARSKMKDTAIIVRTHFQYPRKSKPIVPKITVKIIWIPLQIKFRKTTFFVSDFG